VTQKGQTRDPIIYEAPYPRLPWIWISMNISINIYMCGYQTSAILWIYPWIMCCRIC